MSIIRQLLNKNSYVIILVLVMVAIPFLGLMTGSHVFLGFDDQVNIVANERIRSLTWDNILWMFTGNKLGVFEPLSWLLKATVIELFGYSARVIHLTSLIVHLLNTALLYSCSQFIFRRVFDSELSSTINLISAVVALLWGLNPLRVEVVAWASGQSYAVGAFFALVSFYSYLKYCGSRESAKINFWYLGLAAAAYVAAIFGKSAMVMLPIWFVITDVVLFRRKNVIRVILESIPFAAIALATIVVIVMVNEQAMGSNHVVLSWSEKLGSAMLALFIYPLQSIWPVNLTANHAIPHWGVSIWDPIPIIATALLIALLATLVRAVIRSSAEAEWPLAILAAYAFFLLPVLGFVQHGNPILSGDRYSYMSTMPLYVGLIGYLLSKKYFGISIGWTISGLTIFLMCLMLLTQAQVGRWKNDISLWSHAIRVQPFNSFALNNLGFNYWLEKDYSTARKFLERAYSFDPKNRFPMMNLGVTYYELNRCDLAVEHYLTAAQKHFKTSDGLYNNLGNCYIRLKQYKNAVSAFEKAISLNPRHPKAPLSLAKVREHLDRSQQ